MRIEFLDHEGEGRQFLHDSFTGLCLDGMCYELAIGLNEVTGWPMFGLIMPYPPRYPNGVIRHAFVQSPDGRYFDGKGFRELEDIIEDFGRGDVVPVTPAMIRAVRPVMESDCKDAVDFARKLYPHDFPMSEELAKVTAFVLELEKLSQKYDIWVFETSAVSAPGLSDLSKDTDLEAEYVVAHSEIGRPMLRRDLRRRQPALG